MDGYFHLQSVLLNVCQGSNANNLSSERCTNSSRRDLHGLSDLDLRDILQTDIRSNLKILRIVETYHRARVSFRCWRQTCKATSRLSMHGQHTSVAGGSDGHSRQTQLGGVNRESRLFGS